MGVDIIRLTEACRVIVSGQGPVLSNIGLVVGDAEAVVIDPGFFPSDGDQVMNPIHLWIDRPIAYMVYTHFYPNHLLGSQFFENPQVISHQKCMEVLERDLKTRPPGKEIARWLEANPRIGARWGEAEIRLPYVSFEDELILDLTGATLDLMYLGGGDTDGSIIAWYSPDMIAYVGDLLFSKGHPYMVDADILAWIDALERVKLLEPFVVVPGHGETLSAKGLDKTLDYLTSLRDQVSSLLDRGAEADEIVSRVDLSGFGFPEPRSPQVFRLGILKAIATLLKRRSSSPK